MVLRAPESSLASIPTRVPRHWPHLRNPGTQRTWGGHMTVPLSVRRPCPVPPDLWTQHQPARSLAPGPAHPLQPSRGFQQVLLSRPKGPDSTLFSPNYS